MDFHSLSRRELQALCKTNKIPANVTNVAMADSLKALEIVEGVDEVLQACKSGIYQSSIDPRSRTTRQKDVLLTPAQSGAASRRRRAAKEDSTLKQVYGTRRSARLAEKSAKLLQGVTLFSKKDLFTDDVQDLQMNLEESLDGSVEVSGVTDVEESESKDEEQVESSDKQNVSVDVDVASVAEVEDNDGPPSNLKEVNVPKIEEEHHATVEAEVELNESRVAEIEQEGSGFETEDTKASRDESQKAVGFEAVQTPETKTTRDMAEIVEEKTSEDAESVDETIAENDLSFAEVSSGTVIESDGEMFVAAEAIASEENKEDLELNTDSSETISDPDESDSDNLDITEESTKSTDSMASETSLMSNEDDVSDWDEQVTPEKDAAASLDHSPTRQLTAFTENATVPSLAIQPTHSTPRRASDPASKAASDDKENENEEDVEPNTDSSETKSSPDESDSDNLDITEESTKCNDSMASETSLMSSEDGVPDWDEQVTPEKDAAASLDHSPTHQLTAFTENAAVPFLTIQPTLSTPSKPTSDNKENENEEDLELNSSTDSSETRSSHDESDSLDLTEGSTMSDDSSTASEISLTSNEDDAFDWDEQVTPKKDNTDSLDLTEESTKSNDSTASKISSISNEVDVPDWDEQVTPEKDAATHQLTALMENAAVPPTLPIPRRASASASKATARRDDKESTGSGSKTAPAKERSKIANKTAESVPMLEDLMRHLQLQELMSDNQKAN
ncbi:dentin sialophosphoprotein-like [Salvia divinorum]|uniref:Dentin sialophosphoprotein-like n=1 Tax=Salvia divinorum TaxID=28513 RepID=A0ABD1GT80_SALDI